MFPSPLKSTTYLVSTEPQRHSIEVPAANTDKVPPEYKHRHKATGFKAQGYKSYSPLDSSSTLPTASLTTTATTATNQTLGTLSRFLAPPQRTRLKTRSVSFLPTLHDHLTFPTKPPSLTTAINRPVSPTSLIKTRSRSFSNPRSPLSRGNSSRRGFKTVRKSLKRAPPGTESFFKRSLSKGASEDLLAGMLGSRKHRIFGDKTPILPDYDTDYFSSSGTSESSGEEEDSDAAPPTATLRKLSQDLLNTHQNFLLGKRQTFIEANLVDEHEPFDRKPRFLLPFSPVKHSTYEIRTDVDSQDSDATDLVSIHSSNLPGENESNPGSRPTSATGVILTADERKYRDTTRRQGSRLTPKVSAKQTLRMKSSSPVESNIESAAAAMGGDAPKSPPPADVVEGTPEPGGGRELERQAREVLGLPGSPTVSHHNQLETSRGSVSGIHDPNAYRRNSVSANANAGGHSAIGHIHRMSTVQAHDVFFTRKQKETYFGSRARKDFFHKYRQVARQAETITDRSVLAEIGRSPRSEYLAYLNSNNEVPKWPAPNSKDSKFVLPWPILQRSLNAPRVIDLTGMGLGDAVVLGLVHVFESLPQIDTLLLADNRLTDDTFTPLFNEIEHMHNLTHLDISFNDMDDSSKIILEYLSTTRCNLKILNMEHADIDDLECGDLMEALHTNTSLLTLDLKNNLIGEKEQLNVVMPEFDTGGEVIAEMLSVNTTLTELDVSWNSIRGDSALQVAECLESNPTIKVLILAHNAFGDEPSQKIGDVLASHQSLKHVDLSFNGVTPKAAMVIANAFKTNEVLDLLMMNGNTIGKRGAESLLQALRRSHRTDGNLVIELNNCDCEFEDPSLFDPVEPTNKYQLKMTQPYARMVAAELLRMANTRPGAYFKGVKYRAVGANDAVALDLTQGDSEGAQRKTVAVQEAWKKPILKIVDELDDGVIDFPDLLNKDIRELLGLFGLWPSIDTVDKIMYSLDLSNISEDSILDTIFRSVFVLVDVDCSKQVDKREMKLAMALFAVRLKDDEIDRIISEYDVDKSGEIEEDEFVSWMINKYCKPKQADKQPVKLNGIKWEVPDGGVLLVDFRADRMPPTESEIGSDAGVQRLLHNIKHAATDAERAKLFEKATANSDIFMTSSQAQELMKVAAKGEEINTIRQLLPQLSDPQQCCQLVNSNLSLRQALLLKKQMGPAFGVVLGNATGRYVLDLEKDLHRVAARKIAELNNFEKRFSRTKSTRGDTSQKGNWENFRNENLNHETQKLDSNWFVKIPKFGKLRFDYVSTTRSSKAARPLSQKRFATLCEKLKLDEVDTLRLWYDEWTTLDHMKHEKERLAAAAEEEEYERARIQREFKDSRLRGAVVQVNDEAKFERMMQRKTANSIKSSPAIDALTRGARKMGFYKEGAETETVQDRIDNRRKGIDASMFAPTRLLMLQNTMTTLGDFGEIEEESEEEENDDDGDGDDFFDESSALLKFKPPFKVPDFIHWVEATGHWRDYQESDHKRYSHNGQEIPRDKKDMEDLKKKEDAAKSAEIQSAKPLKAYLHLFCKLQELQVAAMSINMTVKQALLIIDRFPRQEYARVQAVVALHRTLDDLENFHLILRILDDSEAREVVHRLGWLNIFNPMNPDYFFRLDLRYKDHRKMTEILSILAIEEPGDNWLDEEYRWSSYDDPVPGWELPRSWTGREHEIDNAGNCGPRDFGRLDLEYTSDPTLDCNPVWAVREELKNRVLVGTKRQY